MLKNKPYLLTGESLPGEEDCACPDGAVLLTFDQMLGESENDCACPVTPTAVNPTPYQRTPLNYTRSDNVHVQSLADDAILVQGTFSPSGPSVLNQAAYERWRVFDAPRPLQQPIDFQLAKQALLQPQTMAVGIRHGRPQTLTAWLHVTNACNLACPYCYVRKSSERMDLATGLHAVKKLFETAKTHAFKRIKLKYAGGEATLHFKLVCQLHGAAKQLSRETGIEVDEVVLSNGVHMRERDADWLASSNVRLMISLDGVGAAHDQQRPLKGGGKTFASIERTVDGMLLPRGIRPYVTITVTQLNAMGAADAVRWALTRELPVSLNFYRQNVLSANRVELALEEQAIIDGMLAAYAVFEELLPTRPFLNGLLDRFQAHAHSHTCGVGHSYLVVSHKGELAQCQMHLDAPLSRSLNGELIPLSAGGPVKNLPVDEKEGCKSCDFRYQCAGGCPLETYHVTGRWDIKSPHCRIYKTLIPQALRLEGLRLLKENNRST